MLVVDGVHGASAFPLEGFQIVLKVAQLIRDSFKMMGSCELVGHVVVAQPSPNDGIVEQLQVLLFDHLEAFDSSEHFNARETTLVRVRVDDDPTGAVQETAGFLVCFLGVAVLQQKEAGGQGWNGDGQQFAQDSKVVVSLPSCDHDPFEFGVIGSVAVLGDEPDPSSVIVQVIADGSQDLIGATGALESASRPDVVENVEVLVPDFPAQLVNGLVVPDDDIDQSADTRAEELRFGEGAEFIVPHHGSFIQFISDEGCNLFSIVEDQ